MNTLRVCCSCPRCYVPAEEEDSGRRIAPEEAVAHISLFGVSPLLDTPVEDVQTGYASFAPPSRAWYSTVTIFSGGHGKTYARSSTSPWPRQLLRKAR